MRPADAEPSTDSDVDTDVDTDVGSDVKTGSAMLAITRLDDDVFEGWCHDGRPGVIYGGQVAAQALVAAGSTVAEDRAPHSLHAYFVRAGRSEEPVQYRVDRVRDGRSFATRQVSAVQSGKTVFTMLASFQRREEGFDHQFTDLDLPPLPTDEPVPALIRNSAVSRLIDLRLADRDWDAARQRVWLRVRDRLTDDPLIHAAALTYASDMFLAFTSTLPHNGRAVMPVTSLDHAVWLHRRFRADEWLLSVQRSSTAAGSRGFSSADLLTSDGILVASVQQEALIRVPGRPFPLDPTVTTR
jgi:acyl-CoA thioesterase-2